MAIESSANTINDLNPTLPTKEDFVSEGDDHIRLLKQTLRNTFSKVSDVVNTTDVQLNNLAISLTNTASTETLDLWSGNISLNKDGTILSGQQEPSDKSTIDPKAVLSWGILQDLIYPIGCIHESTVATNPAEILGFGEWSAFAAGRVTIGAGESTDTNGVTTNFVAGNTGGEYSHTQTIEELVKHGHEGETSQAGNHKHGLAGQACYYVGRNDDGQGGDPNAMVTGEKETLNAGQHNHEVTVEDTGGSKPFNVVQPYMVVYKWTRTA